MAKHTRRLNVDEDREQISRFLELFAQLSTSVFTQALFEFSFFRMKKFQIKFLPNLCSLSLSIDRS